MAGQPYQNKEWLQKRWFSDLTRTEIADEAGCAKSTITKWARKHGLPHHNAANPWRDEGLLQELYHDRGMSLKEVADHFDCSTGAIRRTMLDLGVKVDSVGEALNSRYPHPQFITHPDYGHEYVRNEFRGERKSTPVHVLIAIAHGVDPHRLYGGEGIVHHKNGIPWDNRPQNPQIMTNSEHKKHHNDQPNRHDPERWGEVTL